MKKIFFVAVLLLVIASTVIRAENKIETKFSGVIFVNYMMLTSEFAKGGSAAKNFNSFDISRVQLGAKSKFSENVGSFIQFEANMYSCDSMKNQYTDNIVYLKQAYLEYKELYPNGTLLFGLIPSAWTGFEESMWKNRFVEKLSADEDLSVPTTERGIKVKGKVSIADYEAIVMNGEGNKVASGSGGAFNSATTTEVNQYKDAALRVAVSPFDSEDLKGIKINGYIQQGWGAIVDIKRNRLFYGASYEATKLNAMATLYTTEGNGASLTNPKGSGLSIFGNYTFMDTKYVFARYDSWDPNKDVSNNAYSRIILGIGQNIVDNVRVALAYSAITQELESSSAKNQGIASANVEVKF
ncbi:MAG: hypothetical protein LHV68_10295 [Elusimicrobia bacterium]|nr:hypothetical protein [Candidatus Liberimonas magnetica]